MRKVDYALNQLPITKIHHNLCNMYDVQITSEKVKISIISYQTIVNPSASYLTPWLKCQISIMIVLRKKYIQTQS